MTILCFFLFVFSVLRTVASIWICFVPICFGESEELFTPWKNGLSHNKRSLKNSHIYRHKENTTTVRKHIISSKRELDIFVFFLGEGSCD